MDKFAEKTIVVTYNLLLIFEKLLEILIKIQSNVYIYSSNGTIKI